MKILKNTLTVLLAAVMFITIFTGCGGRSFVPADDEEDEKSYYENEPEKEGISTGYVKTGDNDYAPLFNKKSESSTIIARMYDGNDLTIYSIEDNWVEVVYDGMEGYVPKRFVSFTKEETTKATTAAPTTQAATESDQKTVIIYDNRGIADPTQYNDFQRYTNYDTAWCSAKTVYIRPYPSLNSPTREADKLYYGDIVYLYGSYGEWYYLGTDSGSPSGGVYGYVRKKNISIGNPPASNESYSATQGMVTVQSANVRSSPNKDIDTNVIGTLTYGNTFRVLSYDGYWYKISYNGGKIGYISHKMVKVW